MQVTIEIEPKTFSLLQKVQEKGVSLDKVLREALDKYDERKDPQETRSREEWIKSFNEWVNRDRGELPPIPDEALRRENLYDDRV